MSGTGLTSFVILCVLFATFVVVLQPPVGAGANVIRVPEDYQTIQEALDNANNWDTIFVHNGTYREMLLVEKSVLLIGEDKEATAIEGSVSIYASDVLLSNFTVRGYIEGFASVLVSCSNVTLKNNIIWSSGFCAVSLSGGDNCKYNTVQGNEILNSHSGIRVERSSGNLIDGNRILYNELGISLGSSSGNTIVNNEIANNTQGVWMYSESGNNTVAENWLANNSYPIYLSVSSSNVIVGNNITNNDYFGIEMAGCSDCSVLDNYIVKNQGGIALEGSTDSTVRGNVVDDNGDEWGIRIQTSIWSFHYSSGNVIADNIVTNMGRGHGGAIKVERSNVNKITSNEVYNNDVGIEIGNESSENVILCNSIQNSGAGVYMWGSGNAVIGNRISDNIFGIQLFGSSANAIHHNSFINNTSQACNQDLSGLSVWDDGYPSGGNYWSDDNDADLYRGPDQNVAGSDGIGDEPYIIDSNNTDYYPLMDPLAPWVLRLFVELDTLNSTYQGLLNSHGVLQTDFYALNHTYSDLTSTYDNLLSQNEQLELNYTALNATYAALGETYSGLSAAYASLNVTYGELLTNWSLLNDNYEAVLADFNSLNSSYNSLLLEYGNLQSTYGVLQGEYGSLYSSHTALEESESRLQADQEASMNKLGTMTKLMFIFVTTTIVFVAAVVYLGLRKRKTKAKT
jgi:parallel beta-helix repeat protein